MKKTCLVVSVKHARDAAPEDGPLVGGARLWRLLGFPSAAAFRQARHRGNVPVVVFSLPKRKGAFAFSADVATWLVRVREEALKKNPLDGRAKEANPMA